MQKPVPPRVMKQLRHVALVGSLELLNVWSPPRKFGGARAAELLGRSHGTINRWETKGGTISEAYALVGLAYRLGGEERARRALEQLAQVDAVEGVSVALKR